MLDRFYNRRQADLLTLYGRRRVGKTRLLSYWLKQRKISRVLLWTASVQTADRQLDEFTQALARFDAEHGRALPPDFSVRDWASALWYLEQVAAQSPDVPFVVIIDEFTNLVKVTSAIPSAFQAAWDLRLSRLPKLRLILTGSLIGLMEQDVLSGRAPLYLRGTFQYRMQPLAFGHLKKIFPDWSAAERAAVYALTGGIPGYLEPFVEADTFSQGLEHVLAADSIWLTDPEFMLREQLREPAIYESILSLMGQGVHSWRELARLSRPDSESLAFYIEQLLEEHFIETCEPVLRPQAYRKRHYQIGDAPLRFYFRFIAPNKRALHRSRRSPILRLIKRDLPTWIGAYTFEDLCREWVWAAGVGGELGFLPRKVGSSWEPGREDATWLTIVAANPEDRRLFIGEARWDNERTFSRALKALVARSQHMPQVNDPQWDVQYGLFSRAGFTAEMVQAAKAMGTRLVRLSQLEERLVHYSRA